MTRLFSTDSMIEQMRRENTHDEEQRLVIIGNGVDGDPYADDNRIWVRDIGSIGEGDYSIGGTAYRVLAGTGYLIEIDHHIWIQWQPGPNMWQGVMSDPDFMRVTGRSMHLLNSNDPHNAFRTTEGLLPLLSKPLPNGKANVQGWQATTEDNLYLDYKGTSDVPTAISQHQNVLSFAPTSAAQHRYVLLVFNITKFFAGTEDPIEMFASTSQSWFTALDATDIQQCLDQMDANSRPIKAYRVYFGQDNLKGHADDRDLRGWLNVPSSVTTIEITSPDGTIDIAEPVTGEFEIDVADNAITQAKMTDNSVGTAEIINANVTTAKLADDAVTIDKLANASVDSIHIIDGAVGTAELATNAVTQAKIDDNAVGTAEIINSNVTLAKLANGTAGKFIGFNASGVPAELDGSIDTTGATAEAWAANDNLYLTASNTWGKIDIDATPPKISNRRGVALAAASHPSSGNRIRVRGIVSGYSGLTPGAPVYASTTAGGYTVTKPTVSVGSGQIVVYEFGYAIDATTAFIDPAPLEYLKRDWLDDDETIAITHHSDPEGHSREPDAYITRNTEVIKDQYASSNRDTDVPLLRAVTIGTLIIDFAGALNTSLGDTGGSDFRLMQVFEATNTGDVGTIRVRSGPTSGTPSVFPSYRIEECDPVLLVPTGVVVTNSSGTMTAWTASADNLITYNAPRPSLVTGTKYCFILQLSAMQATGVTYTVLRNGGDVYPFGVMKWESTAGASFPGTWGLGGGTNDMRMQITTIEVNQRLAQGFTTALEPHITGVDLWLKRTGTFTTEALTASIWLCDGSGTPISLFETSNPVLCSSVATAYGLYTRFDFDIPVELTTNPNWAIVLERDGAELPGAYIDWGMDTSSPGHVGGEAWTYRGSTWALNSPGADACFILYGVGTYYEMPLNVGLGSPIIEAHYGDTDFDDQNTITTYENVSAAGEPRDITARLRFK
jgi:hypothetical protein